jgi:Cu/Ag efflux protein CusF
MVPKRAIVFWLLLLVSATCAFSCQSQSPPEKVVTPSPTATPTPQSATMINPPGYPPTVLDKPYPGTGVVKILNQKEGWVQIDHEEIKDLMPAMLMEFWVRDRSLIKRVKVGDKVNFVVVEDKKGQYLSELKRVGRDR